MARGHGHLRHVAALFAGLALATPSHAASWNVPGDAATLQGAVGLAASGDTIDVDPGTYSGPGNRDIDFGGKNLVLRSVAGAAVTILDGQASGRLLIFQTGEGNASVVEGFTFTNGRAAQGGAMRCSGASPIVVDCVFIANRADESGGAVSCGFDAAPRLVRCRFENNTAFFSGGGISCINASPEITECFISGNEAGILGGGIYCREASPPITDCRIVENRSNGAGGGLVTYHLSAPVVTGCIVAGNRGSANAGAVFCDDQAMPTFVDCVLTGNHTGGSGGAIFSTSRSSPVIRGSTVSGNQALSRGGGFLADLTSTFTFERSILWDNCAPTDDEGHLVDASSRASFSCSDVDSFGIGGPGTASYGADIVVADPLFCGPRDCSIAPTSEGEYGLNAGSPCLPAASPCGERIGALDHACGVTGVPFEGPGREAASLSLAPSPFRDAVLVRYALPGPGPVQVTVHDLSGRQVRSFRSESAAGSLTWNGDDGEGRRMPAGVYFVRVADGRADRLVRRIVKIR